MDADETGVSCSALLGVKRSSSCSALVLSAPPVGVTVPSSLHVPSTVWHSFVKAAHGGDSPVQASLHVHGSGVSGQAGCVFIGGGVDWASSRPLLAVSTHVPAYTTNVVDPLLVVVHCREVLQPGLALGQLLLQGLEEL